MSEFSLHALFDFVDLEEYPSIKDVLVQRWLYSHYIHGCVAWAHGKNCRCPEEQTFAVSVALELAWAAVLILDDILDEDGMRFHIAAAWKTVGTGSAAMEASSILVKAMTLLSAWPDVQRAFAASLETTECVSRQLRLIGFDVSVSEIELLVRRLGSMSVFASSWACSHSGLGLLAEYETCAGQLVNDCNDCFGKKALRRNFPDLRTRQPTLLSPPSDQWHDGLQVLAECCKLKVVEKTKVEICFKGEFGWREGETRVELNAFRNSAMMRIKDEIIRRFGYPVVTKNFSIVVDFPVSNENETNQQVGERAFSRGMQYYEGKGVGRDCYRAWRYFLRVEEGGVRDSSLVRQADFMIIKMMWNGDIVIRERRRIGAVRLKV